MKSVYELIKEFGLKIKIKDGKEAISIMARMPTEQEIAELKARKDEIITYIKNEKIKQENYIKDLEAKREAERDELIASGKAVKAIVYSGSFLADKELAWVSKMTEKEEEGYVDELKGKMYKFVRPIKK